MPVSRMRMRPWLEKQIESNNIPGLEWLNKDKKIFQIPWKHAARHGWDLETDACLFQNWAVHTGRYKPGETEPDPKTWKANFRCAMNSLPDIEEVKSKSINKGSSAVRVYRMLPAAEKPQRKERKLYRECKFKNKKKANCKEETTELCSVPDDHCRYTASQNHSTQELEVDSTVNTSGITEYDHLPQDQPSIKDWGNAVEIAPDSTNDIYPFQVSPGPFPDVNEVEEANFHEEASILPVTQLHLTETDGKNFFIMEPGISVVTSTEEEDRDMLEMAGEFRFSTDMSEDFLNFLEYFPSFWPTSTPPIACPL